MIGLLVSDRNLWRNKNKSITVNMSLPKVQCPICSGNYSKLGINAHVNSCLNALDLSEDDGDTTEPSCQDVRSPPHKLAKLG